MCLTKHELLGTRRGKALVATLLMGVIIFTLGIFLTIQGETKGQKQLTTAGFILGSLGEIVLIVTCLQRVGFHRCRNCRPPPRSRPRHHQQPSQPINPELPNGSRPHHHQQPNQPTNIGPPPAYDESNPSPPYIQSPRPSNYPPPYTQMPTDSNHPPMSTLDMSLYSRSQRSQHIHYSSQSTLMSPQTSHFPNSTGLSPETNNQRPKIPSQQMEYPLAYTLTSFQPSAPPQPSQQPEQPYNLPPYDSHLQQHKYPPSYTLTPLNNPSSSIPESSQPTNVPSDTNQPRLSHCSSQPMPSIESSANL